MNINKVQEALTLANDAHRMINGAVSLDALFIAAYLGTATRVRPIKEANAQQVPTAFLSGVEARQGQSWVVSALLTSIYGDKPSTRQIKHAAVWLRQLGKSSRKSNGNLVYDL